MSPEQRTQYDAILENVTWQLAIGTPPAITSAIAMQMFTASEARERINREGSVVRDMGGKVVAHPAIKIEQDAVKLYTTLIQKNKRPRGQ